MKLSGSAVGFAAAVMLTALALPAAAQINPFRSSRGPVMAKQDQQLLLDATQRLNERPNPRVGGTETWKSPTSSGTVRLDRVFHQDSMLCHAVTYDLIAAPQAPPRTYRLNWCRTPNGEWKSKG